MGPFDKFFDRDNDGKLDFHEEYERMDRFDFLNKQGIYEEKDEEDEDELDELELAGLDRDELEMMDDDERAEALEEAGFDVGDFDDF